MRKNFRTREFAREFLNFCLFFGEWVESPGHVGSLLVVGIEATTAFPAEPSSGDILLEQRTRPVLRVAESIAQYFQNSDARVESDEIGESERTHRVIHSKRHDLIDRVRLSDTFHQTVSRFVDHWHQNPIRDEAGKVVHL